MRSIGLSLSQSPYLPGYKAGRVSGWQLGSSRDNSGSDYEDRRAEGPRLTRATKCMRRLGLLRLTLLKSLNLACANLCRSGFAEGLASASTTNPWADV
jgi:hypothetical protein